MANLQELMPVLQAIAEGQKVEYRVRKQDAWYSPSEDWYKGILQGAYLPCNQYEWRAKQEPKVVWVNEYKNGSAYAYPSEDCAKSRAIEHTARVAVKYQEVIE